MIAPFQPPEIKAQQKRDQQSSQSLEFVKENPYPSFALIIINFLNQSEMWVWNLRLQLTMYLKMLKFTTFNTLVRTEIAIINKIYFASICQIYFIQYSVFPNTLFFFKQSSPPAYCSKKESSCYSTEASVRSFLQLFIYLVFSEDKITNCRKQDSCYRINPNCH